MIFLMGMFFLSYANELSICLRICLSWLNKPVCFTHGNVLLSYVNETMYLLGNLPFFKIHVNCFMARIVFWPEMIPLVDDSIPFEKILSPLR